MPGQSIMVPKQTPASLGDQPVHTHTCCVTPGWEKVLGAGCVAPAAMRQGDTGLLSHHWGLVRDRCYNHRLFAQMNKERAFRHGDPPEPPPGARDEQIYFRKDDSINHCHSPPDHLYLAVRTVLLKRQSHLSLTALLFSGLPSAQHLA